MLFLCGLYVFSVISHFLPKQPRFSKINVLFEQSRHPKLQPVNFIKRYLSVIQHFSLGGVGFKAQDSFSFVKLVFNSPRIHLFMATWGRGSIDPDPIKSLTLSTPDTFPRGVSYQNRLEGKMALLCVCGIGSTELHSLTPRNFSMWPQ